MPGVGSLRVRSCTPDDLPAVLALVRADEERVSGHQSRLVEGDIRDWWQSVDLAENSWLLTAPNAPTPAGVVWLDRQGTELAVGFPVAAHPELLPVLVDLAERRAAELDVERLQVVVL